MPRDASKAIWKEPTKEGRKERGLRVGIQRGGKKERSLQRGNAKRNWDNLFFFFLVKKLL